MFAAYLHERVPLRVFGPAAAALLAAAAWTSSASAAALATAAVLDALLLLQFRVWDDLEDRERDSVTHPDRVLVRVDPVPFRRAALLLAAASIALAAFADGTAAAALVMLDASFYAAYRLVRTRMPDRSWRFAILLVKYPAFVGILALAAGTARPLRLVFAVAAAYGAACVYEAVHSRQPLEGVAS